MAPGNATIPVSKCYDCRLPVEKGHSVFLSTKQNPALLFSSLLAENKENSTFLFLSPSHTPALDRKENADRGVLSWLTDDDSAALVRCE